MALPVVSTFSSAGLNSAAAIVLTKPTGLAVGDLMVAYITGILTAHTLTTPTGWTLQHTIIPSSQTTFACFTKVATSGDVAASNFSFARSTTGGIGGMIIRVTDVASLSPVAYQALTTNTTSSATKAFTTAGTPLSVNSVVLVCFSINDFSGTANTYTSTPSKTFTEVDERTWAVGGVDPVISAASANAGTVAEITQFVVTLSASTGVNSTGSMLIISGAFDQAGTNALLSVSPTQFAQSANAGTTGTNTLLAVSPTMLDQSGRGETPTVWTPEVKTPATWTPEIK